MKKSFILLIGVALLLQSCAKIFYTPDATTLAKAQKIIAIAPPKVSIAPRKNIDANALIEQQKTESVNFQKEMYSWMLKRKMQGTISVEVQDIETTNAKLASVGFYDGIIFTPVEMCNILNVDGIMISNYSLAKPMSEGAAIAVALLVGVWGATNEATVSLSIHDQSTNKMIWNFDHKLSSSLGTPARLVDALMRQASKKMPYFTSGNSY
ncbi:MAG TPA: hypothetical protein VMX17_16205 [Candidatus Glassbacteria bacterium]|nr:hypothetical protein [Candidatus Glassbacteria bacterium]